MKTVVLLRNLLSIILIFTHASPLTETLFSPIDHPKDKLIYYITNAKKKIDAAVYMLTDKDIVDALLIAKQHKIEIRMVVDQASVSSPYAKVFILRKNDIPIYVFDTKPQHAKKNRRDLSFAPLMHNKFAVIDEKLVWTGSFNWTVSANNRNQENVIITDDKNSCQKYGKEFNRLIQLCHPLAENEPIQQKKSSLLEETSFWSNPIVNIQKWITGS